MNDIEKRHEQAAKRYKEAVKELKRLGKWTPTIDTRAKAKGFEKLLKDTEKED
jgi:hypothetical protein